MTFQFILTYSNEITWISNRDFCLEKSENQKIPLLSHRSEETQKRSQRIGQTILRTAFNRDFSLKS